MRRSFPARALSVSAMMLLPACSAMVLQNTSDPNYQRQNNTNPNYSSTNPNTQSTTNPNYTTQNTTDRTHAGAYYGDYRDYSREGFYLGAGAVGVLENFDLDSAERAIGTHITVDDPIYGPEGRVGYRFLPFLAIEGLFQYYPTFDFDTQAGKLAEADGWAATGNLKAFLAPGPVQPYVMAGFGAIELNFKGKNGNSFSDETDMMWRFGGGIDAYITRNIVVYGEYSYNLPIDDLEDFQYHAISAGLQYRF